MKSATMEWTKAGGMYFAYFNRFCIERDGTRLWVLSDTWHTLSYRGYVGTFRTLKLAMDCAEAMSHTEPPAKMIFTAEEMKKQAAVVTRKGGYHE